MQKDVLFLFLNRNVDIELMLNKVQEGRRQERKRGISNAEMYEFEDMESLSKFLLAM